MNKNSRLFWTIATIAIVVLCLGVTVVTGIVINNSIKATAIAYEEPVVDEVEEPVADEVEEPVADEVEEPVADEPEPTYWSNYSCSDLGSCTIAVAPAGGFTIGFTREEVGTCSWKLYEAGENISYQGIHEIHSYKGTLPLTSLEGFVKSQFQFVDACTNEPEPTYWSNYSCSDLGSCTIAVAPAGGFTIGFTREKPGTCSWKIFETGENISYQGIHEIHSYKGTLPLTSLDGFVESQFQFVDACTN